MAYSIKIIDAIIAGKIINEMLLEVEKETITVEELIRRRICSEVEKYNSRSDQPYHGLIELDRYEKVLNSKKPVEIRKADPEKQFEAALSAFRNNGFFIIINDRQIESLEEKIMLGQSTEVKFVKLIPLIGG